MPVNKKAQELGVFDAEEIDLFWRVFDATTLPDEGGEDRERRASRIIANYTAGIRDEGELIELSRKPLGR